MAEKKGCKARKPAAKPAAKQVSAPSKSKTVKK
jgi:hypothetical protein